MQYQEGGSADGYFQLDSRAGNSACISDLTITHLNLDNVPGWIANQDFIVDFVNGMLPAQICVTV